MARKRLIKGANAARVEERIARVPADMNLAEVPAESSIFDALRALEGAARAAPAPVPAASLGTVAGPLAGRTPPSRAPAPRLSARASREAKPKPPRAEAALPREAHRKNEAARQSEAARTPAPDLPQRTSRLSPSDFSAAEREAIVRCCSDYRNRLPTYLLAVQKEVKILDSVIDKCQAVASHPRKG